VTGVLDGSQTGPIGLTPEDMDEAAWSYVLLNREYTGKASKEKLDKLKHEFNYWYPVDIRVSGKELIPNHLSFFLYNHSAVWDNDEVFFTFFHYFIHINRFIYIFWYQFT
jgi:leucyl-tRNA synthetase